jgi:cell division inhibitor SepF
MGAMQRLWNFLGFAEDESDDVSTGEVPDTRRRRAPVFNLHTTRPMEIVVVEPRSFDEARSAAEHLKSRRPVIVNLRDVDRDLARRIVDFSCGVTYAIDGQMQRVGEEIFLFTPSTVSVTAETERGQAQELFPIP